MVAVAETISAPENTAPPPKGFKLAGLDWVGTMQLDTVGTHHEWQTSEAMVDMVHELDYGPAG